jgi:hypothetical protein
LRAFEAETELLRQQLPNLTGLTKNLTEAFILDREREVILRRGGLTQIITDVTAYLPMVPDYFENEVAIGVVPPQPAAQPPSTIQQVAGSPPRQRPTLSLLR